jgi:hypothetical protein
MAVVAVPGASGVVLQQLEEAVQQKSFHWSLLLYLRPLPLELVVLVEVLET